MVVIETIKEVRDQVKEWKKQGLKVGLVPTMGYLHEGHESLVRKASEENDKVVVSIFVNPTQFGKNEDLGSYPRDLQRDKSLCKGAGASVIFHPSVEEMYGDDATTFVNMSGLTEGLCGASRPVHFSGVCTVVSKLFNIIPADRAYFGEKDAQQLAVIKRMVRDLNFDIEVIGCPIIREEDGLAKSSRNTYLSDEERIAATILNKALTEAKLVMNNGERDSLKVIDVIRGILETETVAKVDYVEVVDLFSMERVNSVERSVLVAIAVFIGKTRLIDNFTFEI